MKIHIYLGYGLALLSTATVASSSSLTKTGLRHLLEEKKSKVDLKDKDVEKQFESESRENMADEKDQTALKKQDKKEKHMENKGQNAAEEAANEENAAIVEKDVEAATSAAAFDIVGNNRHNAKDIFDNFMQSQMDDSCFCDKTFTKDLKLTRDITCTDSDGPRMVNGATIDCNGFTIYGIDTNPADFYTYYGIDLDDDGTEAKNCVVKGFSEEGISIYGSQDVKLKNILLENNHDAIYMTGGATVTKMEDVIMINNHNGIDVTARTSVEEMKNVVSCGHREDDIWVSFYGTVAKYKERIICDDCDAPTHSCSNLSTCIGS